MFWSFDTSFWSSDTSVSSSETRLADTDGAETEDDGVVDCVESDADDERLNPNGRRVDSPRSGLPRGAGVSFSLSALAVTWVDGTVIFPCWIVFTTNATAGRAVSS